jgi:hypothetical protein
MAQTYDVLFIGNSYTYYNDLPDMLSKISSSFGDSVFYDQNTPGGYSLYTHSQDQLTIDKINQQNWDYVVLQDQSQRPSLSPAYVSTAVFPYAQQLVDLIYQNYNCTEPLFYMTWGRKNGDLTNCVNYPPVCTYLGMQERLRDSYISMGINNNATVSPVGIAFKNAIALDSTIELYNNDNSHPSIYGTYLAACVFYSTIFKKSSIGSLFVPSAISASDALFLQQIASSTVLDSILTWNIFNSNYSYSVNGTSVDFLNISSNFENCIWDFGDGSFSSIESPSHNFLVPGAYNVKLTVYTNDWCLIDVIEEEIIITISNLEEIHIITEKKNKYLDIFGRITDSKSKGLKFLINNDGKITKKFIFE